MSADAIDQVPLIETVVTTTGSDGAVNCAAMGVRWGERELVFWPFEDTRTLKNLRLRGEAVVHLTDDVLLFVQSALGHPRPAMRAASVVAGSVIEEAHSWREVVVMEITSTEDGMARSRVRARVVGSGTGTGQPLGLCRARHAAVEASIACLTSLDTAAALVTALQSDPGPPRSLQEYQALHRETIGAA